MGGPDSCRGGREEDETKEDGGPNVKDGVEVGLWGWGEGEGGWKEQSDDLITISRGLGGAKRRPDNHIQQTGRSEATT